jgi:hypothetical protein
VRQHHDAILRAFAFAHDDGVLVEIHILHAQRQRFIQAHARAVKEPREQARFAIEKREEALHLGDRQHGGNAALALRAPDLVEPRQLQAEHFLVQEQQCAERLAMRGDRHFALRREHLQESFDLRFTQVARVSQLVEMDIETDPMHIRLFRAHAVVQVTKPLAQLAEQACRTQRRERRRFAGFVEIFVTVHAYSIGGKSKRDKGRRAILCHRMTNEE